MVSKIKSSLILLIATILFCTIVYTTLAYADSNYNSSVIILDDADLLLPKQEQKVYDAMVPITEYGKVIFQSTYSDNAQVTAEQTFREYCGTGSGIIFLIDMGCHEIYIFSDGEIYNKVGVSEANGITDNVYKYATSESYSTCAIEAYKQVYKLLRTGFVFMPMQYINNFLMSFVLMLIVTYLVATSMRNSAGLGTKEEIEVARKKEFAKKTQTLKFDNIDAYIVTKTLREHHSSGGSFGGGGGGGGGSSGGGGGHGF